MFSFCPTAFPGIRQRNSYSLLLVCEDRAEKGRGMGLSSPPEEDRHVWGIPVSGKEKIRPHNPVLIARSIFHAPWHWQNGNAPVQTYIVSCLFVQPALFVRARTERL